MHINAYLAFNGQCEEAFQFYAKVLGGKVDALFRYEGTPAASQMPTEWQKKVMHAHLVAEGATLMGADAPPNSNPKPQGFSVAVHVKDPVQAERIFNGLAEGGKVQMPIQQTFFSPRFGMLTDRYGIPWMINTEQPAA